MIKNWIASPRVKIASIGGLILALALLGWATSALAITWGEPDTDNVYPNVGAFFVERDDGAKWALCSGTLIHEQVFLTAAHCTYYVEELAAAGRLVDVQVSFDFDVNLDQDPVLLDVVEVITHPEYDDFSDPSNPHDVGALVLAEPVTGIEPADLPPTAGFLDDLKQQRVLRPGGSEGAQFTVVGYGGVLAWHGGGPEGSGVPPEITYEDQRRFGESEYVALMPTQLHMDQNRLDENQGTCFGDSGGPAFWEPDDDTRFLVGITSWGDAMCIVTGIDYRVDIDDTLSFIDDVIADHLP